ncbi:MAG TPA: hypothetical protein VK654_14400, partial [Nitrospirota bacterium]|nr:hypothetical protein [Nitrospirota bacterium]
MLRRSRRKHSLAGLAAGIALLAYVCFLLVTNYLSAIDLQNSQLERFRQETTRRSSELGYHFEERRGELRAIARSREIAVYFENRALELSMEYGLKYSLVAINELFRSHLENRQNNQHPFYTAMALVDSGGSLITGQAQPGHKLPPAQSWKPYIGRAFVHGAIVISPVGDATVVSIAYLFRGKYAGQILAQLNQNFFHDIMQIHAPAGNRFSLLFARP